jgi:hypothetical protein
MAELADADPIGTAVLAVATELNACPPLPRGEHDLTRCKCKAGSRLRFF